MLGFPREKESPCVSASPFTSGPREPTSAEYALSTAATSRPPTGSTTSPTTSSTPIPTDAKLGSYIKSQDDWKLVRNPRPRRPAARPGRRASGPVRHPAGLQGRPARPHRPRPGPDPGRAGQARAWHLIRRCCRAHRRQRRLRRGRPQPQPLVVHWPRPVVISSVRWRA